MTDISNWYRVIGLYIVLHIVLFFMEWYKYKHSNWSWLGFKRNGMYELTYCLIFIDMVFITLAIIVWALWPVIEACNK